MRDSLWWPSRWGIHPRRVGGSWRRLRRRSRLSEIARRYRALPFDQPMHANVVHVGIGCKTDTLETAPRLREHERAVAGDLVSHLIVSQLLARQAPPILAYHHDVAAGLHARLPRVVSAFA